MIEEIFPSIEDHAELRAPVADVVIGYDVVPKEAGDAGEGIANDRAADVADVHLLGDVGRGEIDHDGLGRGGLRDAEMWIREKVGEPLREEFGFDLEIDESWTRHGGCGGEIRDVHFLHQFLRERLGIESQLFCQDHGGVRLVVTEAQVRGYRDIGSRAGGQIDRQEGQHGIDALGEEFGKSHDGTWHGHPARRPNNWIWK